MTTLHGIEVKVGDKVWDFRYGWEEVTKIVDNTLYEIETANVSYTSEGKYHSSDLTTTLFWNEFKAPKEAFIKPVPTLVVDTKVLVWNDGDTIKERCYFSHFNSYGEIACFHNEATESLTTTSWDNWELELND